MAEKAVQTRKTLLPESFTEMLRGLMPSVPHLLPTDISTEQFRAALWLELTSKPALRDCQVASIKECAVKAATYGLLPGRDCHFLPFNNKKAGGKTATFVPNYFGILLMLDRTGKVQDAFAHPVHDGDVFICDHLGGVYSHVPAVTRNPPQEQGKIRFYYACLLLTGGKKHVEVMTLKQLETIRNRAPAHDDGPWVTDREEMCRKTVLKRAAKYVKGAPRLQELIVEDEARELTDIPLARHQDNMAALYGMETTTPTDYARVKVDKVTGEVVEGELPFDLDASHALDIELAKQGD